MRSLGRLLSLDGLQLAKNEHGPVRADVSDSIGSDENGAKIWRVDTDIQDINKLSDLIEDPILRNIYENSVKFTSDMRSGKSQVKNSMEHFAFKNLSPGAFVGAQLFDMLIPESPVDFALTLAGSSMLGKLRKVDGFVPDNKTSVFTNKFPEDSVGPANLINPNRFTEINQKANYVVLEDGTLLLGKQSRKAPGGGHIDIANNRPVIAAGEVKAVNGELKYIDNTSGHYQPHGQSAQKATEKAFQALGFDTTNKYIEKVWRFDSTLPRGGEWVKKD